MKPLSAKRFAILSTVPAFMLLGVDAAIGHFAGKDGGVWQQLIPVVFGAGAACALLAGALPEGGAAGRRILRRIARAVGGASVLVGLTGTWFHARPLLEDLADERFSWSALQGA